MDVMNKNNQVVTQDFTKRLVDHCSISFRPQAVTKFAFHHAERRCDVRPLVVVLKELVPTEHVVVIHVGPRLGFFGHSLLLEISGAAISLEGNERGCTAVCNVSAFLYDR